MRLFQELLLKNPLHRKKLQLAIQAITSKQPEKSAELDYIWVTRMYCKQSPVEGVLLSLSHGRLLSLAGWLDDIGLPQYKDQFNEGRVDGQMLQYLTVVSVPVGAERRPRERA